MLRNAGLSWQSRRLAGRMYANSSPSAATLMKYGGGNSNCSDNDGGRGAHRRPAAPQMLVLQSLHVSTMQQQGKNANCGNSGGSSSRHGRNCSAGMGRGQGLPAAWRVVPAAGAAAAGGSVGARRSIWWRSGSEGAGGAGKSGSSSSSSSVGTFSESGEVPADGDQWTPPPDAWEPENAPPINPHEVSTPSGFDDTGGFPDFSAASDAAAAAPDVATAVTATGLSAADLSMYPHHLFMQAIEYVQVNAGVPYWEAIVLVSIATKIAVLPAVTTSLGMSKRLSMIKPQMAVFQEKMQDIKMRMDANPEVREAATREMILVSQEMSILLKQHRIHFPTMFLSMFGQFPVFVSLFLATEDMGSYFPGYMTGGMDWMSNLSAPDPTWTLPILTSAFMILLMELGFDMPIAQGADKPKVNPKHILRAMSIVFIPVAFTMPAGVLVYWTTANIFGLLQRGLFELRPVKQALGWPMPEDMPPSPAAKVPEEPADAGFASKEDLERWGGGGNGASAEASREAAKAAERAREALDKAYKVLHQLERENEEQSGGDGRKRKNE